MNGYYYLEYRKPTSFWNSFISSWTDYGSGVLPCTPQGQRRCAQTSVVPDFLGGGGGGDSNIIDTRPASIAGSDDFRDAPMTVGEAYTDPGAGVSITVTSTGAASATVDV